MWMKKLRSMQRFGPDRLLGMRLRHTKRTVLLGCDAVSLTLQRMRALPIGDVVARQRQGVLILRKLDLKDHVSAIPKAHLRSGEIEIPHPAKALVVEVSNLVPALLEAPAPAL